MRQIFSIVVALGLASVASSQASAVKYEFALGFSCDEWPKPSPQESGRITLLATQSHMVISNSKKTLVADALLVESRTTVYANAGYVYVVYALGGTYPLKLVGNSSSEPSELRVLRVPLGGSSSLVTKETRCR